MQAASTNFFDVTYNSGENKEQIIQRLYDTKVITFTEVMVLLGIRENSYQGPLWTTTTGTTYKVGVDKPTTTNGQD